MLRRQKNPTGFAVLSKAGTKGSVSVHCWARRRGDRGPHPSRNAERAADTAGHSTQMLLWHKRQKEKNEINHEAHKSQFPNRNRLLMMSLQPLLGCTGLEQGSTWIWMEQNQPSSEYPTLGATPGSRLCLQTTQEQLG